MKQTSKELPLKFPIPGDLKQYPLQSESLDSSAAFKIIALCREAALLALQEDLEAKIIKKRHFDQSFEIVTPRIPKKLMDFYASYQQRSGLHML
ncbi:ATPase family protein 2 homolog [Rhincodon typus]|uniref:ATPase family protein 2 homolog n=1 Tax=Rhincodon typus TaxID=259920 RepID=UPI00202F77AD|nr:ATPase family protein 2 homolog [Rhincodon typus]